MCSWSAVGGGVGLSGPHAACPSLSISTGTELQLLAICCCWVASCRLLANCLAGGLLSRLRQEYGEHLFGSRSHIVVVAVRALKCSRWQRVMGKCLLLLLVKCAQRQEGCPGGVNMAVDALHSGPTLVGVRDGS